MRVVVVLVLLVLDTKFKKLAVEPVLTYDCLVTIQTH